MGRALSLDSAKVQALHRKLSELDLLKGMESLMTLVEWMSLAGRDRLGPRKLSDPLNRTLRTHFLDSVARALRQEGGSLELALGIVLARYQGAVELAPRRGTGGTLQSMADLAESVVTTILEQKKAETKVAPNEVVFASSLTLAEALHLGPILAGLVIGDGSDCEISVAARLLGIPALIGVPKVCEFARDDDVVRVDGGAGTVEIIARVATKVG